MERAVVKNYYFKNGKGLMSGIHLADPGEEVRDTHFISCDFHPNTWETLFVNCRFENCDLCSKHLPNAKDCSFF